MSIFLKVVVSLFSIVALAGCVSANNNITGGVDVSEPPTQGADKKITVVLDNFSFTPDTVTLTAGETTEIELTNNGDRTHTFTIEGLGIDERLRRGDTTSIIVTADETGDYDLVCTIPGHKERGMEGHFHVVE